jgi:thiosulfate dehydrogenase [quinone] large subunit
VALLFGDRKEADADVVEVEGPAFTRFLFGNTRAGLFWLPIRIFVGFSFLEAGLHKAFDPDNAWLGGGAALRGYWERAASIPEEGRPPITFEWYRDFINFLLNGNHEGWFAWVVTFGEIAVGVGLLIGLLTGVAAFFGALMNMSFLLAGSGSSNPVLFTFGIGLILAWRVAGYYGLDRYALPMLGTPWRPRCRPTAVAVDQLINRAPAAPAASAWHTSPNDPGSPPGSFAVPPSAGPAGPSRGARRGPPDRRIRRGPPPAGRGTRRPRARGGR